jgi:ABC-type maltose transport system permease subunit
MYAYGNHICVKNAKTNLVTMDSRIVATFTTMCKSSGQYSSPIKAYLEYVGWVEESLELDYGTTCVIVLLWVKANYKGTRTIMKQYEYGLTFVNFNEMLPFLEDSFAFPIHVEQIFFFDDPF